MGFSSIDDFLNKATNLGVGTALQTHRYEWNKQTGLAATFQAAYTANRWYDLNLCLGQPSLMYYGDLVVNPGPYNSAWGWTGTGSGGWVYTQTAGAANGVFTHTAGTTGAISQAGMSLTNGVTYLVVWTIGGYSGSGNFTVALNGGTGVGHAASGTYYDSVVAGASGGLTITAIGGTAGGTIANVHVIYPLQSFQLNDTNVCGAMYHGGNVSPSTKHIINAGAVTTAATGVPGVLLLCDFLLAYPGINLATSPGAQTLLNSNALPRYTNGIGVKPFVVYNSYSAGAIQVPATAQYINILYSNTTPTSGQTMSSIVTNQGAAVDVYGHLLHTASAANNYGPFLPLAAGDTGVTQVASIAFTSATGTAAAGGTNTFATLVLARPLLELPLTTAFLLSERNYMTQLTSMPRIYDGACLGWLYFTGGATAASTTFSGYLDVAWGA